MAVRAMFAAAVLAGAVFASPQTLAQTRPLSELMAEYVTGCRILADQGVIADGFGHMSFRSPSDPTHFFMARGLAAGLVTQADVMEFDLDTKPIDQQGRRMFSERAIHAEIYRARPDVNAVVHSHAPSVLPFSVTGTPLGPVTHMGGFLPRPVPLFEIRDSGGPDTNMLVRTRPIGAALAATLGAGPVVLMRGHGFTAVGVSVQQVVFRSIYTDINAKVLTEALKMGPVTYLNEHEAAKIAAVNDVSQERSWEIWAVKALANSPKP